MRTRIFIALSDVKRFKVIFCLQFECQKFHMHCWQVSKNSPATWLQSVSNKEMLELSCFKGCKFHFKNGFSLLFVLLLCFLLVSFRCERNNRVSERLHRKITTFEWPFSRTLSSARKARPSPKDAQFCQVYFSHWTFLMWVVVLYLFAVFPEAIENYPFLRVLRSILLSLLRKLLISRDRDRCEK